MARHPPFSEDVILKLFLSFSGPVSSWEARAGPGPLSPCFLLASCLSSLCCPEESVMHGLSPAPQQAEDALTRRPVST